MQTDIFDGLFSKKDDSISKHLELQTKAKVQSSNRELEVWLFVLQNFTYCFVFR